jgi:hypothetical protein
MSIEINGEELVNANPDGVNSGTVVSLNGESIRVLSREQAIELLAAAEFILENFKDV